MKKQLVILYSLLVIIVFIGIASIIRLKQDEVLTSRIENEYSETQELISISEERKISVVKTESKTPEIYIPEIDVDIDTLLATNEDYKGWLFIPETGISLPIVMGNDNSYYLKHTFNNNYSDLGCLYYDVSSVEGSQNRVIYGHNFGVNSDLMFSPLINYQDQNYADEHKYVYVVELDDAVSVYQIYAVVNFDITYISECDYRSANFESDEHYDYFISYLLERSCYISDFIPEGEELLTLQTCNRQYGSSNRLLICGAKIN